jgi:hypothetical protein
MDNQEKLNSAVEIAQSYILLFLKEYMNSDEISNIKQLFQNCPIVVEQLNIESNEFGKLSQSGGMAEKDKIVIGLSDIKKTNMNNEYELNKLLGTIIHEYAHKIRSLKNEYGGMLEEAFATIFAETCINNARLKISDKEENIELFGVLTSIDYQKYESQVRAILYVLKQNGLDYKLIAEYIAGNQESFKQSCTQVFGENFNNYFNSISSRDNKKTEQMVIGLITNYIKEKGLNISNYWENANYQAQDYLYLKGSPTLSRAVINCGIESFKPEQGEFYKYFESSARITNDNDNFIIEEKIDRIKQFIENKYSLKDKSIDEIYDTIIDMCSTYIQHQNRDNEESKIFIEEIKKIIPDIDTFKTKFVSLRISGKDRSIFDNLDLDRISYVDIESRMDKLLQEQNIQEENISNTMHM